MAEGNRIEIYRNMSSEELTTRLADPENKAGTGSAAAASAALAAALLERAARMIEKQTEKNERVEWLVRNTEILRSYMIKLIDEDIKCHGPLRKALKEDDSRKIEASRQAAVSICLEIVNMMGKYLELSGEMVSLADDEGKAILAAGADIAYGASLAAGRDVLHMSTLSPDETYRYIIQRENELTMIPQREAYERIIRASSCQNDRKTER